MIHFNREYIDQLLAEIDMLDIMQRYGVKTKWGSGRNHYYIADFCCSKKDFDNGRIKKKSQTFRCLSCGFGGNAIHFLRFVTGMTFYETIVTLAQIAKLPLPEPSFQDRQILRRKELAMQLTVDFYHAQNNFSYLLSRGISLEILKKNKAGYAPGGPALRKHLESHGFSTEELTQFKLINTKGLDTFYHRAIIPIYRHGKIVDIYGRATKQSKLKHFYLNGDLVLGGYDEIDSERVVKIYESAIDRLAAESAGVTNGVDTGGANAFSKKHANLLFKKQVTKTLTIYDGDAAGYEGALNVGEILHNSGIRNWIVQLPENQDPANLIRKGNQYFYDAIKYAKKYETVKLHRELSQYDIKDIQAYLDFHQNDVNKPALASDQ